MIPFQQILHMPLDKLSACVKSEKKVGEETEFEFEETNFDQLVTAFLESLEEKDCKIVSQSTVIQDGHIVMIIQYLDEEDFKSLEGRAKLSQGLERLK